MQNLQTDQWQELWSRLSALASPPPGSPADIVDQVLWRLVQWVFLIALMFGVGEIAFEFYKWTRTIRRK